MKPGLLQRGPMRRRLRILRRRREAMLLDLGALVLEMHRHGRFLPDGVARRAAEAVGTDAELRALSRSLEAGDGDPDLVAAGIAGNCEECGALHSIGAAFCSQCGTSLEGAARLPRKAALGRDPQLAGGAPIPRRTVAAPPAAARGNGAPAEAPAESKVLQTTVDETEVEEAEAPEARAKEPETETPTAETPAVEPSTTEPDPRVPLPGDRRARATRVRQRLNEPAQPSPAFPTSLLAGIGAGVLVIVLAVVILSSGGGGGDDGAKKETDRAAQAPAQGDPEPPPEGEPVTPTPGDDDAGAPVPGAALEPVEGVTAKDYDPAGDDQEHAEEARLAVDGDDATSWPTEEYETGALQKEGVGLVLEPAEALPARGLDIETTTPGFDVTIYGAETELPDSVESGWAEIANEDAVGKKGRINLDAAGNDFAYYLVWITEIPADDNKVEISEARLLR